MFDTIEIAAAFDEKYAQHAAVMMLSVLKNTSRKVIFHCLVSTVSALSVRRLEQMTAAHGSSVVFHHVDEGSFHNVMLGNLTIHAYFRLLIPALFAGKSRILYLDVDIVAKGDVGELFNMPMGDEAIAAVADPGVSAAFVAAISLDGVRYFNSGVLMASVDRLSTQQSELWLRFANEHKDRVTYQDQCVLNHFMGFKAIHPRFNLMSQFFLPYDELKNKTYSRQEVEAAKAAPVIVHFNTYFGKPWERGCTHPLRGDYLRYLLLTPWRWHAVRIVLSQLRFRIRNIASS